MFVPRAVHLKTLCLFDATADLQLIRTLTWPSLTVEWLPVRQV
jgi:hypothetical protein